MPSATEKDFKKIKTVGWGAYGKVYMVEHLLTKKIFAMKVI